MGSSTDCGDTEESKEWVGWMRVLERDMWTERKRYTGEGKQDGDQTLCVRVVGAARAVQRTVRAGRSWDAGGLPEPREHEMWALREGDDRDVG